MPPHNSADDLVLCHGIRPMKRMFILFLNVEILTEGINPFSIIDRNKRNRAIPHVALKRDLRELRHAVCPRLCSIKKCVLSDVRRRALDIIARTMYLMA